MYTSLHIVNKLNSQHDVRVKQIEQLLTHAAQIGGIPVVHINDVTKETLVVAAGGDGTMLEAMRIAAYTGATALGVNLGRIGFLTDLGSDNVYELSHQLTSILEGTLATTVERRMTLRSSISIKQACNEFSVAPLSSDTMITYQLEIDGISAGTHRANSILVSTPTGSTAYSLSAGGALMIPSIQAIQLVPVAPMTMTSRPIIVPPTSKISLRVISAGGVSVRCDGQLIQGQPQPATKDHPFNVTIKRAGNARVLHLRDWNFFDVLTEKLGWIKE